MRIIILDERTWYRCIKRVIDDEVMIPLRVYGSKRIVKAGKLSKLWINSILHISPYLRE